MPPDRAPAQYFVQRAREPARLRSRQVGVGSKSDDPKGAMDDRNLPGNATFDPMRTYRDQSPELDRRRRVTRVPDKPLPVPDPRKSPENPPEKPAPEPRKPKDVAMAGVARLDVIKNGDAGSQARTDGASKAKQPAAARNTPSLGG